MYDLSICDLEVTCDSLNLHQTCSIARNKQYHYILHILK